MPKLESPFVRKLNEKGDYVVCPEVNPGFEWVFEDSSVLAIEKLHGTNVSIVVEDGVIKSVWNRTERIPFFNKGKRFVSDALLESFERGYCDLEDGQWFGEVIGPKVNGNPYYLDKHVWIPFVTYAKKHLVYKSWGKYPKTFDSISEWFKDLQPLYWWKIHGNLPLLEGGHPAFVEGVVFTHPDGRLAKLRRDQFDWFSGPRHREVEERDVRDVH